MPRGTFPSYKLDRGGCWKAKRIVWGRGRGGLEAQGYPFLQIVLFSSLTPQTAKFSYSVWLHPTFPPLPTEELTCWCGPAASLEAPAPLPRQGQRPRKGGGSERGRQFLPLLFTPPLFFQA